MTKRIDHVNWYECHDCGMRLEPLENNTMRPNNKFCEINCMRMVLKEGLLPDGVDRPIGYKKWLKEQEQSNE